MLPCLALVLMVGKRMGVYKDVHAASKLIFSRNKIRHGERQSGIQRCMYVCIYTSNENFNKILALEVSWKRARAENQPRFRVLGGLSTEDLKIASCCTRTKYLP
jgi:hypothetical protein